MKIVVHQGTVLKSREGSEHFTYEFLEKSNRKLIL